MTVKGEDFLELVEDVLFLKDPDYFQCIKIPKQALEHSIAKWKFIVSLYEGGFDEYIYNGSSNTCALCQYYHECGNCPVQHKQCQDTPYYDYFAVLAVLDEDDPDWRDKAIAAAKQEVAFLEGLRINP